MSSMKIELSTIGRTHVQWDDMGQHHTVRIALAPDDLATLAAANGYIKLEPGQVVVDERQHTVDLAMAAQWANHVRQQHRGVCHCAALDANGGKA